MEVWPKAKGLDTRLKLIEFYEENYSANLVHLPIYSKGKQASLSSITMPEIINFIEEYNFFFI